MKVYFILLLALILGHPSSGQSLELMAGQKNIFADVQWLKPLDQAFRWTVFSRTRATVDYDNQTDLFSGAYLNYTSSSGLGASLVGKIGGRGAGADLGLHFFKAQPNWTLFGLASVSLKSSLEYSWFSILRLMPPINQRWKWYLSLELFNSFNGQGHVFSVQRLRLGVERSRFQFGFAANFSEVGSTWASGGNNIGGFVRRSF